MFLSMTDVYFLLKCLIWLSDSRYLLFACSKAHLVSVYDYESLSMDRQFNWMEASFSGCFPSEKNK